MTVVIIDLRLIHVNIYPGFCQYVQLWKDVFAFAKEMWSIDAIDVAANWLKSGATPLQLSSELRHGSQSFTEWYLTMSFWLSATEIPFHFYSEFSTTGDSYLAGTVDEC